MINIDFHPELNLEETENRLKFLATELGLAYLNNSPNFAKSICDEIYELAFNRYRVVCQGLRIPRINKRALLQERANLLGIMDDFIDYEKTLSNTISTRSP